MEVYTAVLRSIHAALVQLTWSMLEMPVMPYVQ
jgi:hypothetical protein